MWLQLLGGAIVVSHVHGTLLDCGLLEYTLNSAKEFYPVGVDVPVSVSVCHDVPVSVSVCRFGSLCSVI